MMITWKALVIVFATVAGIACCGIGAIALLAAGRLDNPDATRTAEREGCIFGVTGLLLMAAAGALRFL
jgi:hypothetical protein